MPVKEVDRPGEDPDDLARPPHEGVRRAGRGGEAERHEHARPDRLRAAEPSGDEDQHRVERHRERFDREGLRPPRVASEELEDQPGFEEPTAPAEKRPGRRGCEAPGMSVVKGADFGIHVRRAVLVAGEPRGQRLPAGESPDDRREAPSAERPRHQDEGRRDGEDARRPRGHQQARKTERGERNADAGDEEGHLRGELGVLAQGDGSEGRCRAEPLADEHRAERLPGHARPEVVGRVAGQGWSRQAIQDRGGERRRQDLPPPFEEGELGKRVERHDDDEPPADAGEVLGDTRPAHLPENRREDGGAEEKERDTKAPARRRRRAHVQWIVSACFSRSPDGLESRRMDGCPSSG